MIVEAEYHRQLHSWTNPFALSPTTIVGKAKIDGKLETIKGPGPLEVGRDYLLNGEWAVHEKYGRQFRYDGACKKAPVGLVGIGRWLQGIPGIGAINAAKIMSGLGEGVLTASVADIMSCGVSTKIANEVVLSAITVNYEDRARMDLWTTLVGHGVRMSVIDELYKRYNIGAADAVRGNPYILAGISGCGFLTADRVYLAMGGSPSSMRRKVEAMVHSLRNMSGSTWVDIDDVAVATAALVTAEIDAEVVAEAAEDLGMARRDGRLVALDCRAEDEMTIVRETARLLASPPPPWLPEAIDRLERSGALTRHQAAELRIAVSANVGCLCGGPGTGKTRAAIKLLAMIAPDHRSIACAFTGKATARMRSCADTANKRINFGTIHSVFGLSPISGSDWNIGTSAVLWGHPHDNCMIVVDESSMNDSWLTAKVLESLPNGCNVLFVGDDRQLPPIGHGRPFIDMIQSGKVPVGRLVETHRNGGSIVSACDEVGRRKVPEIPRRMDIDAGQNLIHVEASGDLIPAMAMRFVTKFVPEFDQNKYQIICPYNKGGGPASRERLNGMFKSRKLKRAGNLHWDAGDKVICRRNHVANAAEASSFAPFGNILGHAIYNGMQGIVVSPSDAAHDAKMLVRFDAITINATEDITIETPAGGPDCVFEHAYAITAHLSQGSEWEWVAVCFDDTWASREIMSSEWLVTAMSRARKGVALIGPRRVLEAACAKTSTFGRRTLLKDRLIDMVDGMVARCAGTQMD